MGNPRSKFHPLCLLTQFSIRDLNDKITIMVRGIRNFEVFKTLMERVVEESKVEAGIADLEDRHFKLIAHKIKVKLNIRDDTDKLVVPISFSAIRDYIHFYLGKNPKEFSVMPTKLNHLCAYIGHQGIWTSYIRNYGGPFNGTQECSFYQSPAFFEMFMQPHINHDQVIDNCLSDLQKNPKNLTSIFDLGMCLLYKGLYSDATRQFEKGIEINPLDVRFRLLLSLSLLSGKRPFRHKKRMINEIQKHLRIAIERRSLEAYVLEFLIYKDFYKRIGYDYLADLPEGVYTDSPSVAMKAYFAKCCGLTIEEIDELL